MIDKRPALIALCTGAVDVINAVNFARANSLLVTVAQITGLMNSITISRFSGYHLLFHLMFRDAANDTGTQHNVSLHCTSLYAEAALHGRIFTLQAR
jgi:hypothetical protein